MAVGYCVKCKEKGREMKDPEIVKTSRGGYMAKGKCVTCNTNMSAMLSKDSAEKAIADGAKKSF